MKTLRHQKATHQIRVIRVSRPSVIRPVEREDSRIPSVSINTTKEIKYSHKILSIFSQLIAG